MGLVYGTGPIRHSSSWRLAPSLANRFSASASPARPSGRLKGARGLFVTCLRPAGQPGEPSNISLITVDKACFGAHSSLHLDQPEANSPALSHDRADTRGNVYQYY